MSLEIYERFHQAAQNLEVSAFKVEDACLIIDDPDFHKFAKDSPDAARGVLVAAFNVLGKEDAFQTGMAFIETPGARAMPAETLIDVLVAAKGRLTDKDQDIFTDYVWHTRTGRTLLDREPIAKLKLAVA